MSVSKGPGRQGSRWRRTRAACMVEWEGLAAPCSLCGLPINYAFTRAMPRHRLAGTAHHVIGLAQGGDPCDPGNLAPAHLTCNVRESNRVRWAAHATASPRVVLTSRAW